MSVADLFINIASVAGLRGEGPLDRIGETVIACTPPGRLAGDEDLMGTVVFPANAASRHVTGQFIALDRGSSAF